MTTRVQARIVGRVQGVGFRPTVYRYATQLGLAGFVRNDPHGVVVEVEGAAAAIATFFDQLEQQPPAQAVIAGVEKRVLAAQGDRDFAVVESEIHGAAEVHIAPDLATCDDCLRELDDPQDRRHGYPFINCTHCGPRFTIIRDLPYDRAQTSMAGFTMCPTCDHEYHDPTNRRFHAQPDACVKCGPLLRLDCSGTPSRSAVLNLARGTESRSATGAQDDSIVEAAWLLRAGQIVAIKSLGGYHLACDAMNPAAVALLRARKHRPHKPLAVMFRDIETVKRFCQVSETEEAELLSVARPIVLLKSVERASSPLRATDGNGQDARSTIAPDSPTVGAFLPYTPLHHLLLAPFDALVMTSSNIAEEPIASDESELPPFADAVLTHNRPILHKCDDSVVRIVNGQRQFFRRARGFVPNAIRFAENSAHILAVGGELKNTFCLARDGFAFLSQHIGDLKAYRTHEYFQAEIAEWQRLMRVAPVAIAHDLHPGYRSTRWAEEKQGNGVLEYWSDGNDKNPITPPLHHSPTPILVPVQHHHAHIASVMAEHDLHEPLIGVALDGTGYGPDGTIWGGEFLVATRAAFERVAHFKPYRLPGGAKAIEEPWRMAVSILTTDAPDMVVNKLTTLVNILTTPVLAVRGLCVAGGVHAPWTSSAGRLFDAVAALLGLCDVATYEAQAAIRLEAVADPRVTARYGFAVRTVESDCRAGAPPADVENNGNRSGCPTTVPWILDFGAAVRAIVAERGQGVAVGVMAAKFHNTVAAAVVEVCQRLREQRGLATVALSGGVWQNEWLLRRVIEELQARRFQVFTNVRVPPNDGGLALGQVAVAAARVAGCSRSAPYPEDIRGESTRSEARRQSGVADAGKGGVQPCV